MNRRSFLRLFGISAAVVAADPEALLWTPGKLISIPSVVVPHNRYLTISMITNEMLMVLHKNMTLSNRVMRNYEAQFRKAERKMGSTVQIQRPRQFTLS